LVAQEVATRCVVAPPEISSMKNLGMLIAAIVLAALAGTYYWSNHRKPTADTTASSLPASPVILAVPQPDITGISINKKGATSVVLGKDASGAWTITSPKAYRADQDTINGILTTVSSLNADRLIDEKASDLSQYGLAQSTLEIDVMLKGNQTKKVLVGDDSPAGGGSFAMLAGDPRVYKIATFNKSALDKSVNDLRDKRLLTEDFDKVSQIELNAKKREIEFARGKDEWQIVKPVSARADGSQVDDLVQKLRGAKFDIANAEDTKKAAAGFAAGTQFASVKITGASGAQELQIRKNKNDYFGKSTVTDGAYKIANDLAQGLDKSLDDFRNKKLFDFGFADPNRVELHDGAKNYAFTHTGSDWFQDGKKLDLAGIENLIEKVRDLAAVKFPENGFGAAQIDLLVVSNENKRTERIQISKNGDRYIAKRENEPALYELNAADATAIEAAADGVKPAADGVKPAAALPGAKH
jgi:hypothetical protein